MIEINNLTKRFDKTVAVDSLSMNIDKGSVVGLIGSNGGGKSTILRLLAGVYQPDDGTVCIDGDTVFDNAQAKGKCFFIPDFPYFYNNSTINNTAILYKRLFPNWSDERFEQLCSLFPIGRNDKIINMSKGMQRQAALILALSTCPKYLFLDEIFDGLDPVVRLLLKKLLAQCVSQDEMTVIIASHNLRELEDLCDRVCLIHHGKAVVDRDLDSLKVSYSKVQVAFSQEPENENPFLGIPVISLKQNGNVYNITIKGKENEFMPQINALNPAFVSAMPLTLEEVFICEMEVAGYDVNNIT